MPTEIFILRNGQQSGPFSENTLNALVSQGSVELENLAWRNGLADWLPLSEVLKAGASTPPPAPSAIRPAPVPAAPQPTPAPTAESSPTPANQVTSKQKALLAYLGVTFNQAITKEEAALLVSDALENPKFHARFGKWHEEKFRLHPDVFADELEVKKQNRVAHYFELCQTEGTGVVEGVSRAHCQVLIESLDKRFPSWEANPREALWDYFMPAISEHFPQVVKPEWRARLKIGGTKLPGALAAPTSGQLAAPTGLTHLEAAVRGVIYGLVVLGLILGGLYLFKQKPAEEGGAMGNSRDNVTASVGR